MSPLPLLRSPSSPLPPRYLTTPSFLLQQVHERAAKERHDLRREAQAKIEASAARLRVKQQRIVQLEKSLRDKSQVEEEVKMYREQCNQLMEQLSAKPTTPRARTLSSAGPGSPAPSSMFDRMASFARGHSEATRSSAPEC